MKLRDLLKEGLMEKPDLVTKNLFNSQIAEKYGGKLFSWYNNIKPEYRDPDEEQQYDWTYRGMTIKVINDTYKCNFIGVAENTEKLEKQLDDAQRKTQKYFDKYGIPKKDDFESIGYSHGTEIVSIKKS